MEMVDDLEKIKAVLAVIHYENSFLMKACMRILCYPQDYDKTCSKLEEDWSKAFNDAIGV